MTNNEYKLAFIRKHDKGDWHVDTSPMDEYGRYVKTYVFSDGAQLTEVNEPHYETALVEYEVRGVKFSETKTVKLFRTECWNTDDAKSVVWYEKF